MKKETPKVSLGLDLSLTHTGYCVIEEGGKVLASGVIKSKPNGDRPLDELWRLKDIVREVQKLFCDGTYDVDIVVIENLAFQAKGTSLTILAGLSYLIRDLAYTEHGKKFVLCAPMSLKKFIAGTGKAEKDHMMMAIYKDYGFESLDNNEADAYGLAAVGLSILEKPIKKETVPQKEVIKLLKRQL